MRKTTSYRIGEEIGKKFKLECIKNDVSMSVVLENLMLYYVTSANNDLDDELSFNLITQYINRTYKGL